MFYRQKRIDLSTSKHKDRTNRIKIRNHKKTFLKTFQQSDSRKNAISSNLAVKRVSVTDFISKNRKQPKAPRGRKLNEDKENFA